MGSIGRARPAHRRTPVHAARRALLLLLVCAAAVAVGTRVSGSSPAPASSSPSRAGSPDDPGPAPRASGGRDAALGIEGGAVPDGTTPFDDGVPGVANLRPGLLGALRRAAADAAGDRVAFVVHSGWRSPAYQRRLLREAVRTYGSEAEASRWVAGPRTSAHVSGDAVDVGPPVAAAWLSRNGSAYGLCRVYANEPWHFELRPDAAASGCPPLYADPTQDPRLRG